MINIALVGCGRVSTKHLEAIAANKELCRLVALCDVNTEALGQALEKASLLGIDGQEVNTYTSYDELLTSKNNIDLVCLCTPSGLHADQVIKASHAKYSVCTEKPMATRFSDGVSMVRACDKADVRLFVVKQNRFNPTLQLLKRQIVGNRFGRINLVTVNVFWQRPQSYYDLDPWRGTWEFDGGALMNQASHYVDLLEWLVGPVKSVSAVTATLERKIEVEDTAAMHLTWRSGALGTLAVTMLTYPSNMEGSFTILGSLGSVRIAGKALNQITHWDFDKSSDDDKVIENTSYSISDVYGSGHTAYYRNMLNSMLGSEEAQCTGREGLKSLELLTAAYRSARANQAVFLPLEL